MHDQDGGEDARVRGRPTTITERRWLATGINNGRGGVVSVVAGTEVDALFADDGRLTGSDGCREYSGHWATNGDRIALGAVEIRPGMVPVPEGAAQQADAFIAAMGRATTFRIEGTGWGSVTLPVHSR